MSINRRRSANVLPVARIFFTALMIAIFGGGALYYVNAKNEVHRLGQRMKTLEAEIHGLDIRNESVMSRIATLSSYESLRKRQSTEKEAFAQLVPVSEQFLVKIPDSIPRRVASEVRTVSNLQPAR